MQPQDLQMQPQDLQMEPQGSMCDVCVEGLEEVKSLMNSEELKVTFKKDHIWNLNLEVRRVIGLIFRDSH